MPDAPLIVGVSGLRGIVGESLTPEVAVRYAAAFGTWLKERYAQTRGHPPSHRLGGGDVAIGWDGRAGGACIYNAAIAGLQGVGCRVVPLGVATTPTVGCYVTRELTEGSAGMVITASHNPGTWNGLKCLVDESELFNLQDEESKEAWLDHFELRGARAPTAVEASRIIELFRDGPISWTDLLHDATPERNREAISTHSYRVWEAVSTGLRHEYDDLSRSKPIDFAAGAYQSSRRWRVVLDSVNASGAEVAERMLRSLHTRVVQVAGDGSGIFPHTPEPTAENLSGEGGLCDAVPGLKADIGFAQDPDADRLAIVDENGRYIGEEYTLVLCAESLLSAWKARGDQDTPSVGSADTSPAGTGEGQDGRQPVMVVNLSTSRMIEDVAAKYGARVERTAVGEANVVERMKALKASGEFVILGGEGNGGVIWPEVTYVRDSLSGMALVLSLMARSEMTLSELVARIDSYSPGGKGYAIVKTKAEIPSKDAAKPAVDAVAKAYADQRVDLQDGVRVDFDPSGPRGGTWVHVRASNTEPIMRLICEAPTAELAREVLAEVNGVIGG